MECSQPGAIREEELLAYLAGESVRPAVAQHLASCERCAAQLEAYRRMELTLTSVLYRWDCPPSQVLGEYQLGLLKGDLAIAVKFHLHMCVHCATEMVTLTEFLANDPMLAEQTSAPRVTMHPAVLNHRRPVRGTKQILDEVLDQAGAGARRIIATLLPPQPRFAHQREMAQAIALWPRRYAAGDFSISIHVERGTGRRDVLQLIGFVTRKGEALEALRGTPALLSTEAGPAQSQSIDELGNFVFESISPATYTLELQFPEGIVVIDGLQVALQD